MGSGLMSEVFLNQILNTKLVDLYEKSPIESFLRPSDRIQNCQVSSKSITWFSAPAGYRCLIVEARIGSPVWKIFARKQDSDQPEEIGELRGVSMNLFDQRGRSTSILEITESQSVFTPKETAFRSFMMGPMILDMGFSANYFPHATKEPKPVYIAITSTSLTIQGLSAPHRLEPVFIFNSPISILLMMPPSI
jgi:hypothetical protein